MMPKDVIGNCSFCRYKPTLLLGIKPPSITPNNNGKRPVRPKRGL
jgi:hypothetical protein